jgi:hypothetical protein
VRIRVAFVDGAERRLSVTESWKGVPLAVAPELGEFRLRVAVPVGLFRTTLTVA